MADLALTPHGPVADACLRSILDRCRQGLRERRLLPPETLAHYLLGAPAIGEGWVAQEGDVWVPYETLRLLMLLPPEFETEAGAAAAAAAAQLEELCQECGYGVEFYWATERTLADPAQAHLAYELQCRRQLLWSFGGGDPLGRSQLPLHPTLAARQLFLDQGPRLEEIAAWLPSELFGMHPGIVRLAFIRAVEVLTDLGEVVLIAQGAVAGSAEARARAMTALVAEERVMPTFAQLYRTALTLRTRQPRPRIPDWDTLRGLLREVPVWARHVAHVHLGAEVVEPAA